MPCSWLFQHHNARSHCLFHHRRRQVHRTTHSLPQHLARGTARSTESPARGSQQEAAVRSSIRCGWERQTALSESVTIIRSVPGSDATSESDKHVPVKVKAWHHIWQANRTWQRWTAQGIEQAELLAQVTIQGCWLHTIYLVERPVWPDRQEYGRA